MFFPKLRRRAKWVFLALAIAFGGGFIFFGVGAGGSGIGDYFADLFNRQPAIGGVNVEDAQERVAENPRDSEAQLDLATALQAEGRNAEAITALERYTTMRPRDADALRTLASLYGARAAEAVRESQAAQAEAQTAAIERELAPENSPFAQELASDRITGSLSEQANARAQAAQQRAQRFARLEVGIYERLTLLVPDDPLLFLQFGQAAETATDYESAIVAYERFLDLAPNDPSAETVKARIDLLKSFTGS
jgi:regulator of sirC expression with transglutaminase-like and TPR domain